MQNSLLLKVRGKDLPYRLFAHFEQAHLTRSAVAWMVAEHLGWRPLAVLFGFMFFLDAISLLVVTIAAGREAFRERKEDGN